MREDQHVLHYLALLTGLLIDSALFVYFRYNVDTQIVVALLGSLFYIGWGVLHHAMEGRVTLLIVLEYILVGSFAFMLLFTALKLS